MKERISVTIDREINDELTAYCTEHCASKSGLFEKFAKEFLETVK